MADAKSVLNVGAGTGSYEPDDRYVLAVEPLGPRELPLLKPPVAIGRRGPQRRRSVHSPPASAAAIGDSGDSTVQVVCLFSCQAG